MKIFGWGSKQEERLAVPAVVPDPTPDPTPEPTVEVKLDEATKAMWMEVYKGAINVVYEPDDLKPFTDREYANRMVRAARNLADAAIEEYEDRWGL